MLFTNNSLTDMSTQPVLYAYNLPDYTIFESPKDFDYYIGEPDNIYIVLGRSNNIEGAINCENVKKDGIITLKRPSGGESVILSPNMLIFSFKQKSDKIQNPAKLFKLINSKLIENLSKLGIENLYSKGISDLSIGEKKIMGSSMFTKNKTIFYHGVLNISEDVELIEKYLKHPSKEPDYRKKRSHREFVSSLQREGYNLTKEQLTKAIEESILQIKQELNYINQS
jgi:lipoate-protein ligase A